MILAVAVFVGMAVVILLIQSASEEKRRKEEAAERAFRRIVENNLAGQAEHCASKSTEPIKRSTSAVDYSACANEIAQQPTQAAAQHQSETLMSYLKKNNVRTINNVSRGGALWIVGDKSLAPLVKECKDKFGVTFSYKADGAQCADRKPAWWTTGVDAKGIPLPATHNSSATMPGQISIFEIQIDAKRNERDKTAKELDEVTRELDTLRNAYKAVKSALSSMLENDTLEKMYSGSNQAKQAIEQHKKLRNAMISYVTTLSVEIRDNEELVLSLKSKLANLDKELLSK